MPQSGSVLKEGPMEFPVRLDVESMCERRGLKVSLRFLS